VTAELVASGSGSKRLARTPDTNKAYTPRTTITVNRIKMATERRCGRFIIACNGNLSAGNRLTSMEVLLGPF
jgi:hypothetical protein